MGTRTGTLRPRGHPGRGQLAAVLVLICLVLLSVTFLLGLLAGRQWARSHQSVAEVDKNRHPVLASGDGLKEREVGRPPQIQEKLTFYHTLTAPLGSAPSRPAAKVRRARAGAAAAENEEGVSKGEGPADGLRGDRGAQGRWVESGAVPVPGLPWTVQVAAYRSRNPAAALQRSLAASGYGAYITTVTGQDGTVRYRVRVGSYPSRSEAEKVSERLRAEGALTPLVVPR